MDRLLVEAWRARELDTAALVMGAMLQSPESLAWVCAAGAQPASSPGVVGAATDPGDAAGLGDTAAAEDADGRIDAGTCLAAALRGCVLRLRSCCGQDLGPTDAADAARWTGGNADAQVVAALTAGFRVVRNACAVVGPRAQAWAVEARVQRDAVHPCMALVGTLIGAGHADWQALVATLARVSAQVAANVCVGHAANQRLVGLDDGALDALVGLVAVGLPSLSGDAGAAADAEADADGEGEDRQALEVDAVLLRNVAGALHVVVQDTAVAAHFARSAPRVLCVLAMAAVALDGKAEAPRDKVGSAGKGGSEEEEGGEGGVVDETAEALTEVHSHCVWLVGQLVDHGQGERLLAAVAESSQHEYVLASLWLGHRLDEEDQEEASAAAATAAGREEEDEEEERNRRNRRASVTALATHYARRHCERHALAAPVDEATAATPTATPTATATPAATATATAAVAVALPPSDADAAVLRALGSYARERAREHVPRASAHPLGDGAVVESVMRAALGDLAAATRQPEAAAFGLRVHLLRLIGGAAHGSPLAQGVVCAHRAGLHAVLNQCGVDASQPFLREWAIVAIRNLTENNLEVQDAIAELRAQGTVNTSLLNKAGLEVRMTPDGKPNVVPAAPDDAASPASFGPA